MSFATPQNSKGVLVEHDFTKLALGQVHLTYKGKIAPLPGMDHFLIECEVYRVDGILSVHTVCPKCHRCGMIDGRNKNIEYDQKRRTLHIPKFKCSWEMTEERRDFGFGMCGLELEYAGKVAKDA